MPGFNHRWTSRAAVAFMLAGTACGPHAVATGSAGPARLSGTHWMASGGDVALAGEPVWPGDTAAPVQHALPVRVWSRVTAAYRSYSYWAIGYGDEGPTVDARGHPLAIRTDSVRTALDSIARWARVHRAEPVGCVIRDRTFMRGDTVVVMPLAIRPARLVMRSDSVSAFVAGPVCEGRYPYVHGHLAFVRRQDGLPNNISASDSAVARRSRARYHVLEIIDSASVAARVWTVGGR